MKPSATIFLAVFAVFAQAITKSDFSECIQSCVRTLAPDIHGLPCYGNEDHPMANTIVEEWVRCKHNCQQLST